MANDSKENAAESKITQPPHHQEKIAPQPPAGQQGALETVVLRNEFYRDSMHMIVIIAIILCIIISGLVGYIFYKEYTKVPVIYFATDSKGSLIPMVPLQDPHLPDNVLNNWAMEAATAAFSYNFFDYREKLDALSKYFTPRGHQQLIQALQSSGNLDAVRTSKLASYAVADGVPTITNRRKESGRYTWDMQVPIKVEYRSNTQQLSQNLLVRMKIVRLSTLDSERGVGIEQFIAHKWAGRKT